MGMGRNSTALLLLSCLHPPGSGSTLTPRPADKVIEHRKDSDTQREKMHFSTVTLSQ